MQGSFSPAKESPLVDDPLWLLLALAYPAVFVNLGHNGFLTAALLAGALAQLDRRPFIAGTRVGLLA
jgi:alpha-1,2-mannosyltransferase